MNGKLGRPYKFTYISKGQVSGLVGITATVIKPNNANFGTFVLVEETHPALAARYYFYLDLSEAQPEGEYLVGITEPSGETATGKVTMEREKDVSFSFEDYDVSGVILESSQVVGTVEATPDVVGVVSNAIQSVSGVVEEYGVAGIITEYKPETIFGTVECVC